MPANAPQSPPPVDIHGLTCDGDRARTVHLRSADGMTASVLTLGARLLDLRLADGRPLTLSFSTLSQVEADDAYVGVAVGRTANRIRGGKLRRYNGIDARAFLERNEHGRNHTHGGRRAWDKRLFAVKHVSDSAVELFMFSPDGDQGYPSSVEVSVRYELTGHGEMAVALTTTNVGHEQTVTNMTLHPYFDLTGRGGAALNSVFDYVVHAPSCDHYLVLDPDNVPTGEIATVQDTRFDLRQPRKMHMGAGDGHDGVGDFPGYDQYFVASHDSSLDAPMQSLVTVTAPAGSWGPGVEMQVLSNQPGFQMYTANGFDATGVGQFAKYASVAVEPSGFIDAANNAAFPTIALEPQQTRRQLITYKFRTVEN